MTKSNVVRLIVLLAWLSAEAAAQKKPDTAPSPAPVVSSEDAYALPLAERDKFRDLQHEIDSIEIENQRMLVKIEQNKARQAQIVSQEQLIAWDFAQARKIDLSTYELDPNQIRFKKKPVKP